MNKPKILPEWFWGWWHPVDFIQSQCPSDRQRPWRLTLSEREQFKKRLSTVFYGEKPGEQKGQGLDLRHLREYQPGDDLRKMDWNVYARTATPHVREYFEEKQRVFWFVLDLSPGMWLGYAEPKVERLYWLMDSLWPALSQQGHRVGVLWFDAEGHEMMKPVAGIHGMQTLLERLRQHLLRLEASQETVHETLYQTGSSQSLEAAMTSLVNMVGRGQRVVCVGDFNLPLAQRKTLELVLGRCQQKAPLLAVSLSSQHELTVSTETGCLFVRSLASGEQPAVFSLIPEAVTLLNAWQQGKERQFEGACQWLALTVESSLSEQVYQLFKALMGLEARAEGGSSGSKALASKKGGRPNGAG